MGSLQLRVGLTITCDANLMLKHHLIVVHSRMSPSLTAPHLEQVSDNSRRPSIRIVHDLAPSWWPCCPIYLFPQLAFSPPSPALYPEGFVQNTIIFSFLGHSSHYHEVLSPLSSPTWFYRPSLLLFLLSSTSNGIGLLFFLSLVTFLTQRLVHCWTL